MAILVCCIFECGASFAENGDLEIHIASVHGEKKLFKCKHCDLSFVEKIRLKNTAKVNAQRYVLFPF